MAKSSKFRHTPRELVVLNRAHAAMMDNIKAGCHYDVILRQWVEAGVPTQAEIMAAASQHGIAIPEGHPLLGAAQNAYRKVNERGGIAKIGADIEVRIAAARKRLEPH